MLTISLFELAKNWRLFKPSLMEGANEFKFLDFTKSNMRSVKVKCLKNYYFLIINLFTLLLLFTMSPGLGDLSSLTRD